MNEKMEKKLKAIPYDQLKLYLDTLTNLDYIFNILGVLLLLLGMIFPNVFMIVMVTITVCILATISVDLGYAKEYILDRLNRDK